MNSTTPILSLTQPQRATLSWDGFINGDLGILDSYAGSVSSSISSLSGSIAGLSAFTLNGTTGSVSLVAGNNITLSQALSQITISAGSFSQSVQTQGSVLVNGSSGSIVFTAGTNITLSQNASTITIIGASGGSQSVQTQSTVAINGSTGSIVLTAGNNVTLSQNASTITISAANQSIQTQGSVLVNGSSGSIVLTAGNNITLSQNASTVTISAANQSIQTQSTVAVNGSTGQISLVAGNNISLSQNASTITISASNAPAQTNQTIGVYASSQTVGQSSSSTLDARSFTHVGQGIVSVGLSAGSLLISATTAQSVQTQNCVDISLSGTNTAGVLTLISSGTMLLAGGNNITLSQNGQSITISGPNVGGAQTGISGIIVSNTTYTSGTVSFSNANGISFGSSAGQAITASYTVPTQSVQTQSTVAVNGSTGNISIVAGNNISLSQNASTITISASNQSAQTQNCVDITLGGSTAGVLTLISSGTLFLAGGNNIILSQNGQSVTISGPNTVAQTNQTLSLNMTSNTAGNTSAVTVDARSLTLQGIGIASVGLSTSAGGTSVIVSASQTVQTQNCVDVSLSGSTAGVLALVSSGTMILAGGNNIILSQNGQSITISGPNTVAQSNQTLGIYASSQTAGATSSSTYDARSLTVVGSNAISVGWTNGSLLIADAPNFSGGFSGGNTAGTTSIVTGEVVWAGGNNITLSGATAAGGVLSVTISAPNQDSQGISNIGNTSGNSGMVTGQMVLAGGNNVTLSGSTNAGSITVTISAPNFATNTNNLAWSLSGNSTSAGGGYVLISTGTGILAGGNNITLSQNGQSVTVSAGGGTLSKFFWPPLQALYSLSSSAMTNASASVQYVPLDQYVSFTRVDVLVSVSPNTSGNASSAYLVLTNAMVIYTRNVSTFNAIVGTSQTQTLGPWFSNAGSLSNVSGLRYLSFPLATLLSPGEYWIAVNISSSSGFTSGGGATTALSAGLSLLFLTGNGIGMSSSGFADFGSTVQASTNIQIIGMNNTNITATNSTMQLGSLTITGTGLVRANLPLVFRNY